MEFGVFCRVRTYLQDDACRKISAAEQAALHRTEARRL
jgi:hypothetical protein